MRSTPNMTNDTSLDAPWQQLSNALSFIRVGAVLDPFWGKDRFRKPDGSKEFPAKKSYKDASNIRV